MKAGWKSRKLSDLGSAIREHARIAPDEEYELWSVPSFESGFPETAFGADIGSAKLRIRPDDVLICKINPRINRVWLVTKPANGCEQIGSTEWMVFRANRDAGLLPRWLIHFVSAPKFREWIASEVSGATGSHTRAKADGILQQEIPLPSLAEQQRIVGILDKAFQGIATARANAEQNRQNARALFDSRLDAVFTQRGDGWVKTTLGDAYDVRDGTHDSPKYHATGYPLVTSKNLKREGLSFEDVRLISKQDYNKINERSAVHKGDLLFAMIGTIGSPTLVTVEPNFAIKNVALFKIPSDQSGAFLKHYLSSRWVISKMMTEAKGTTQKFVGLGYLRDFPINIPPLATQLTVVRKLDELSEETQRLESICERKYAALETLKKSLLHQAFIGNL